MTIFNHEVKQNRKMLFIWSGVVGFMIIICMIMYPEMQTQMTDFESIFANMGDFTAAFGMDKINFGSAMGFYGIECGNVLGIGGAFFAALIGVGVLSKEENGHTAEFLLTHPISRFSVVTQKLLAVICQILFLNIFCMVCSIASFGIIGESIAWREFLLFHMAQLFLQIQIASICFGISAFVKRGGIGIGLGFAALLYFLNIIGNISEEADFVKYITPFKYAEPSDIISDATVSWVLISVGAVYAVAGIVFAFVRYTKKDIAS